MSAREASEALCEALEAEPVQCIGSKLVIYKANPKKADAIKLPKA
jgi:RNA-binding protein YhbY